MLANDFPRATRKRGATQPRQDRPVRDLAALARRDTDAGLRIGRLWGWSFQRQCGVRFQGQVHPPKVRRIAGRGKRIVQVRAGVRSLLAEKYSDFNV